MKRLAIILLVLIGTVALANKPASARPYGWYGYRPYPYRAYYGPRPYWGGYYRYPYRAFYPGVSVGVGFGYPGYYGAPAPYYYGYPAYYGYYRGPYWGW